MHNFSCKFAFLLVNTLNLDQIENQLQDESPLDVDGAVYCLDLISNDMSFVYGSNMIRICKYFYASKHTASGSWPSLSD